jgi:hypothetical protein
MLLDYILKPVSGKACYECIGLKAQWLLLVPSALTLRNSVLFPRNLFMLFEYSGYSAAALFSKAFVTQLLLGELYVYWFADYENENMNFRSPIFA